MTIDIFYLDLHRSQNLEGPDGHIKYSVGCTSCNICNSVAVSLVALLNVYLQIDYQPHY